MRAPHRNEIKTRLDDRVYSGLRAYMARYGIASESAALARIVTSHLFGEVGTMAFAQADVADAMAHIGPMLERV